MTFEKVGEFCLERQNSVYSKWRMKCASNENSEHQELLMQENDNAILRKSQDFALQIVFLYKNLSSQLHEYVLSKQILRSGTSIGANVKEAQCAQSRNDFYTKLYIAFKEAAETEYWLELLNAGQYLPAPDFTRLWQQNRELLNLLGSITKNFRNPPGNNT